MECLLPDAPWVTNEPESRCGLEIDRVPSRSDRDFPIDAASRLAGLPADPAERDTPRREEALLLPTTGRRAAGL